MASDRPQVRRGRRGGWLGWGLIALGVLVLAAGAALTGVRLWAHARSLREHLAALEGLVGSGAAGLTTSALGEAGDHLAGMREDLEAIDSLAGPFLPAGRLLAWVPGYGGDLAAASDLLEVAQATTAAGDRAWQALAPALEPLTGGQRGGDAAGSLGERLLPALVAAQPELRLARQELERLDAARARIGSAALSPRVAALVERLDRYLPWFEAAVDGASLAPRLLGAGQPRTYLILIQNSDELRPTGGFLSGVGELRVEQGRVVSLDFRDSYAVDNLSVPHELAPADLKNLLLGELWFFRDTNWDADGPTSLRRALDVYARDRGVQADGAVALDLAAMQLLLGAFGPLPVEGLPEPVTADNIVQVVREQWGERSAGDDAEWWLHRKDFVGQIAGAALGRLLTGEGLDPVRLAQAVRQALDEKHLLLYLTDPQAAALLRERGWDGALPDPSSAADFLLVVDTNVGFNKVDANVERSIGYRLDLGAPEGPEAWLTLTYQNRSQPAADTAPGSSEEDLPPGTCLQEARYGQTYADLMNRCYWDYLRAYVPGGSQLVAGPEIPLPPGSLLARTAHPPPRSALSPTLSSGEWVAWTAFFDLAPGAERRLTFVYRLPPDVLERGSDGAMLYRLRVQKQPGTGAVPLRVEILLPESAALLQADPPGLAAAGGVVTDLRTDREFQIRFCPAEEGP